MTETRYRILVDYELLLAIFSLVSTLWKTILFMYVRP